MRHFTTQALSLTAALLVATWPAAGLAQAQAPATAQGPAADAATGLKAPSVELPAVFHKWTVTPTDQGKRKISAQELEQCMAQDAGMQKKLADLRQRQSELETVYTSLVLESKELPPMLADLSAEHERLRARVAAIKENAAELDRRHAAIKEQSARQGGLSKQEVQSLNERIAAYNADAARSNGDHKAIAQAQEALQPRVEAYNARITELNRRAASFNEQNAAFNADAQQMNEQIERFALKCAGERVVQKK